MAFVPTFDQRRVTLSLAGLGWLDETEVETVKGVQVREPTGDQTPAPETNGSGDFSSESDEKSTRLTQDQARELKRLAQQSFGYREGERRLRADLGFEVDESLTLRHLAAHVSLAQYTAVMETYAAELKAEVEADVP